MAVTGLTGASALTAGYYYSCAMTTAGAVKCWGRNHSGQLGDGTTTDRTAPVAVSGLTGATAISGSYSHSCAVANGRVLCWGYNRFGQLGDGTLIDHLTPAPVTGL